ncbi:MAG: TetR/AcrR family transcriptional regulator [Candidatus Marinimicrobia bacterium]|nr:TetR/AcrR family transcriptional regulator [Candidatus Neomarinimicrobiota bacterium]
MNNNHNKKDKILEAAIQVFAQHGYERGTVSEIANAAGIAKGSFYHYFSSKEEIIYDLFDLFFEQFIMNWEQIIDKNISPVRKIKLLIDQTFEDLIQMQKEKDLTKMILIFEIMFLLFRKSLKDKSENNIEQLFLRYYDILVPLFKEGQEKGIFRSDIDPEYAAYLIFGMIDGFSLHFIIQKDNYDIKESKKYLIDLILNGLVNK